MEEIYILAKGESPCRNSKKNKTGKKMSRQYKMVSKIGTLYLVASEKGLQKILWKKQSVPMGKTKLVSQAVQELTEYFDGQRKKFDLSLDVKGTPFQERRSSCWHCQWKKSSFHHRSLSSCHCLRWNLGRIRRRIRHQESPPSLGAIQFIANGVHLIKKRPQVGLNQPEVFLPQFLISVLSAEVIGCLTLTRRRPKESLG